MIDLRRYLVLSTEPAEHVFKNTRILIETAISIPASAWAKTNSHRSHIAYQAPLNETQTIKLSGEFNAGDIFKITELSLTRPDDEDISLSFAYPNITIRCQTVNPADFANALRALHVLTHEEIDSLGYPEPHSVVSPFARVELEIFEILAKALPDEYIPGDEDIMLLQYPSEIERWNASMIPTMSNKLEYDLSARQDIIEHIPTIALVRESAAYRHHYIIDAFSASMRMKRLNPMQAMNAFAAFTDIRKRFTPAYGKKD